MSDDTPSALAGAVHTLRLLADGTVAVTLHFEPRDRMAVMSMMGAPGQPVGVAPLKVGFAAASPAPERKGDQRGALCKTATDLCRNADFQMFVNEQRGLAGKATEQQAKEFVLAECAVVSRKDLDTQPEAGDRFRHVLVGFNNWRRHQ